MNARRRTGVEAGETFRRMIGGAVLRADQLHTRAKTTRHETPAARETAFEQPNDPSAPAAWAHKNDPEPPFRAPPFDPELDAAVGVVPAIGGHDLRQSEFAPRIEGQRDIPLAVPGGENLAVSLAVAACVVRFNRMGGARGGKDHDRSR